MLNGNPGLLGGLNVVGMSRSGIEKPVIHAVRRAYKQIFEGQDRSAPMPRRSVTITSIACRRPKFSILLPPRAIGHCRPRHGAARAEADEHAQPARDQRPAGNHRRRRLAAAACGGAARTHGENPFIIALPTSRSGTGRPSIARRSGSATSRQSAARFATPALAVWSCQAPCAAGRTGVTSSRQLKSLVKIPSVLRTLFVRW